MAAAPPSESSDTVPESSGHRWAVDVGVVLLAFALLRRWTPAALHLPEEAYVSPVLSLALLRELIGTPEGWVALVPLAALAGVRGRALLAPWPSGERALRVLVLGTVAWATWAAVTWDHNLYFGQSYDLDRAALIGFAALAMWRPGFVLPHVFLFIALEHQFDHPFGRQVFARRILEDLLLVFAAWWLVGAALRRRDPRAFLFVACAALAAMYWVPGWVKLTRGWVWHGQLYLGGFASWANGWLATWPAARVEALLGIGALLDWPGRVSTLGAELAALLFFVHRRVAAALLVAWMGVHVGIWVFSGVSFLVWIAVDLAFLWLVLRAPAGLFGGVAALVGGALILTSPLWLAPPPVGWFDTPVVYTYRYVAETDVGEAGAFPADATPLGEAWCARDFPFLVEEPGLLVRYGKTNDPLLAARVGGLAPRLRDLETAEADAGRVWFDPVLARTFDRWLARVGRNWNDRGSQRHVLSWAAPPRTCLSPRAPPEEIIPAHMQVRRIHVDQVTFVHAGGRLHELRRKRVRTVPVE